MGVVISAAGWLLWKILQIFLLLLGVLALLAAIILLTPVRYCLTVEGQDKEWTVQAKATWFFRLLSFSWHYGKEQKGQIRFRLLWFDVMRLLEREKKPRRQDKKKRFGTSSEKQAKMQGTEPVEPAKESARIQEAEQDEFGEPERAEFREAEQDEFGELERAEFQEAEQEEAGEPERAEFREAEQDESGEPERAEFQEAEQDEPGELERISSVKILHKAQRAERGREENMILRAVRKIKQRIEKIVSFFRSIRGILGKVRKKADWAGDVKTFWRDDNTRHMVCILKENVLHLWRKLKPRVVRGDIVFGLEDPAATGQALGAAAILFACYGRGVHVRPDFTRKRLEGTLLLKGKISLATFVLIVFRVIFHRSWKQFAHDINQLKEAF